MAVACTARVPAVRPVIGQDALVCGGRGRWNPPAARAIGSAGERLVHTEEVTGSIPVSPTRSEAISIFEEISAGAKSAAIRYGARDGGRRGWGEDSIYFD